MLFCQGLTSGLTEGRWPGHPGNPGTRQHRATSPSVSLEQLHQHPRNTTSKGTREGCLNPSSDSSWIPENPRPSFWQEQKSFQGSTARCNQTQAQTEFCRQVLYRKGNSASIFAIRCLVAALNTPAISPHHFIFLYHKLFNRDMTFCLLLGSLYLSLS